MIKLIASDIDGTLIPDSTPDLYPEMVEEIKKLTDRGILFCGASGRQLASIRRVFREVEDQICYIAENGAHVYYKGKDLALTAMKPEYARQIVEQLRGLGSEYEFTVSTPHGSLLETKNRLFLDMMKYGYHNIFRQVEDVLAEEEVILKIAVYQNRYKNCRSEHSEHMLQTKQQHFRRAQNPGISYNVFLLIHYEKLLLIIVYSNIRQSAGALAYV